MDDSESPFRLESEKNQIRVVDASGRIVLNCADPHSAEQYAALLNEAYRRGYKAGYRAAREARKP